jgi:hypothetical protein
MEDVVISSLHHKTWCFVVVLYRVANVHGGIPAASSAAKRVLAWDQEIKRKKAQRKVGFFGVSFSDTKRKETGSRQNCRERVENVAMGVSCCAEGISVLVSPRPKSLCRQKDKKGVVPKIVGYRGPATEGLISASRKIIDQKGVRKRELKTEERSAVSSA